MNGTPVLVARDWGVWLDLQQQVHRSAERVTRFGQRPNDDGELTAGYGLAATFKLDSQPSRKRSNGDDWAVASRSTAFSPNPTRFETGHLAEPQV